jgi:hypothetical protein
MNLKTRLFLILILVSGYSVNAQISYGGEPVSFSVHMLKQISLIELPVFDYQKMIDEDKQTRKARPFRYGKTHQVNLSPNNCGTWLNLDDGRKIWQLKISSQGAFSLSLLSDNFKLNPGVDLFIYSPDKKQVIGSFNSKNNVPEMYFSTVPISGSAIVVELDIQAGVDFGIFNISGIVHDYKNVLKAGFGSSGSCNVNINCPEGADWQLDKKSVMKYIYTSGLANYLCTGVLVNNTAQNAKPYVLTAEHCISSSSEAASAVFWFNYESPECVATINPSYQSLSSASLVSTGGTLDFSLLELSTTPPADYNVYYAGWNRGTNPAENTTCIHHPQGDIKKISLDYDPPVINNYGSGYVTDSHWNIIEWDLGTTEGGSSGSPLFDQNHRIVGNLTGGDASCSYNFNDYFSRFDMSWDYFSDTQKQLKAWLDPLNLNVLSLDGLDPSLITDGLDARLNTIIFPTGTFCGADSVNPQILFSNIGSEELTSLFMNYQFEGQEIISEQWTGNLQAFESGIFTFPKTKTPIGAQGFKAFISIPNGGVDINLNNDTLVSTFTAQDNIQDVEIIGDEIICPQSLNASYSTNIAGLYSWLATGGIIDGSSVNQDVSIVWDKWGIKKLELNVMNLCNSVDAQPFEINIVELGVSVEIRTGENASSICWNITDNEGTIIYQTCGLPSDTLYSESIFLPEGNYLFNIIAGGSVINEFSLSSFCDNKLIASAQNLSGTYSKEFLLISSDNNNEFNIYPNPCSVEISIEASLMDLYTDATYTISNLSGAVVVPKQRLNGRTSIDISKLPRGMYLVEISSSKGKFPKKMIKLE